MIKLIIAVGPNGLIGNKDKMPWNIPDEFKHFKKETMGHWLFMGQTTYNGLPTKLPGRKICVIGPDKTDADYQVTSFDEAVEFINKFNENNEDIYIAGGKSVYEGFYKYADELIVSEVNPDEANGDIYINWDLGSYNKELIYKNEKFNVYKYTKGEK